MHKNALILLVFAICIIHGSFAQSSYPPSFERMISAPTIPFVSRATVDYTHIYEHKDHEITVCEYNWNESRSDVSFSNLWQNCTARLNEMGLVTHFYARTKTTPYALQADDHYEYDSEGRIISMESANVSKTLAYYTNTPTDSIVRYQYDDYTSNWYKMEKVERTLCDGYYDSKIYTFNNEKAEYVYKRTTRYFLDECNRVIKSMDLDSSAGQIYEYSYLENGYTETITWYGADHASFKYEYTFYPTGALEKSVYSEWTSYGYWRPCITESYSYDYLPAGLETILNDCKYRIENNSIVIEEGQNYCITHIDGHIISVGTSDETPIEVPKQAVLLLTIEGKTRKLILD